MEENDKMTDVLIKSNLTKAVTHLIPHSYFYTFLSFAAINLAANLIDPLRH